MYLATKAMTLHLEFREQYPPCLVQNMALFVDLVHPLRTSAVQVLDLQVSKQQAVIVDTIKQAGEFLLLLLLSSTMSNHR